MPSPDYASPILAPCTAAITGHRRGSLGLAPCAPVQAASPGPGRADSTAPARGPGERVAACGTGAAAGVRPTPSPRILMLCVRLRRGDWIQIEPGCPCKPRASAPVAGCCAPGRLGDSWSPPGGSRGILRRRLRRAAAFLEEGAVSRHCLESAAQLPAPGRRPSAARLLGRPPRAWPHSHAPHCGPARPGARVSCSPPIGAASSRSGFAFLAGGRLGTRSGPGGPRSQTLELCGIPAETQSRPRGS